MVPSDVADRPTNPAAILNPARHNYKQPVANAGRKLAELQQKTTLVVAML
jgi:hypothetical protein